MYKIKRVYMIERKDKEKWIFLMENNLLMKRIKRQ